MKYGVTINEKDSLTEWGLMLLAGVKAEPPKARTKYVTVPEMDGALDLTEALTGRVSYNQRNVSFELFAPLEEVAFENVRSALSAYANGQRVKLWLPDDPDHYFYGRMSIGGRGGYHSGKISVSMVADPWKYKNAETTVSFDSNGYKNLSNEGMPTVPRFIATDAGTKVTLNSMAHTLVAGENRFDDFIFAQGNNRVRIQNIAGSVEIRYQEGRM